MIKVEFKTKEKLSAGTIDAGCEISIMGNIGIVSIELANLLINITEKYPNLLDAAMQLIADHETIKRGGGDSD